jgi:NDP-sugar pyrophosphorylase family protein
VGRVERLDLPMLVKRLITQNKLVRSYIIQGEWFDIGTPDDLQSAIDYFESKKS